ncbi:MAG: hypothetical protein AAGG48_17595 [Planctomycetota bacterium]
MRDNPSKAAERFADRVRSAPPESMDSVPDKVPLFPSPDPAEYRAFACHRQGTPVSNFMLRFHAKDGVNSYSIEYAHQQAIEFRTVPDGQELLIRYYSGERVMLAGRNLEPLYIALNEHRVVFIHAIDEFTALGAGFTEPTSERFDPTRTLVFGITIRIPDREQPLVLASDDPFKMAGDQPRPLN